MTTKTNDVFKILQFLESKLIEINQNVTALKKEFELLDDNADEIENLEKIVNIKERLNYLKGNHSGYLKTVEFIKQYYNEKIGFTNN